jgi:hypothetical protein
MSAFASFFGSWHDFVGVTDLLRRVNSLFELCFLKFMCLPRNFVFRQRGILILEEWLAERIT